MFSAFVLRGMKDLDSSYASELTLAWMLAKDVNKEAVYLRFFSISLAYRTLSGLSPQRARNVKHPLGKVIT